MAGVVVTGPLAGCDTLSGGGSGVFGAVLQPLHHLALDGGADRLSGGHPELVGGPLELLLALLVAGIAGTLLRGFNHLGGGVGQRLGGRQEAFLERRKAVRR